MSNPMYRLFVDLDGVLVDFNAGFKQVTGYSNWDDAASIIGVDEIWRLINLHGSQWWSDLGWVPGGQRLWKFIRAEKPTILTAGATSKTGNRAIIGKKDWCRRHLGADINVIVCDASTEKKNWARPNHILIDDLEENITAWRSKNGIGIHHVNTSQTIQELERYIRMPHVKDALDENWRALTAAGMLGLSTLKGSGAPIMGAHEPMASSAEQVLMSYENSKANAKGGWNATAKRWYPHRSLEGGADTIAYGHKLLPGEDFSRGITDMEAMALLRQDIAKREMNIRKVLPTYDDLPGYVKIAIISAWYRGDLSPKDTPKTLALMRSGKWSAAAIEYLNHNDFRNGPVGVKKRMQDNANAFAKFGASQKITKSTTTADK